MGWFSAYLYTKYNISNHKQQSTYVNALIMLAEQEMKFIQRKNHVLLSDEGFWIILCLCVAAIGGRKTVFGRNEQHLRMQLTWLFGQRMGIGHNTKEIQGKVGS
jgi:hypothetical protein